MTEKLIMTDKTGVTFTVPPECFYLGYRGSIAHGMYVPPENIDSIDDIDLMGFCVGSETDYFGLGEWGSRGTKEFKAGQYDVVLYEARKAVSLLLQGNPNIMSMLWLEPRHRLIVEPIADLLFANRQFFVGKHVYNAFAGYAHQQMEKMESRDPEELREYLAVTAEMKFRGIHPNHKGEVFPAPDRDTGELRDAVNWAPDKLLARLRNFQKKGENIGYMGEKRKQLVLRHSYDTKNAAHLIRLLRMCVEFMKTGEMHVYRQDAAELLEIKTGKWKLEDVKLLADDLWAQARAARDASTLPDGPNREGAERVLVSIIRSGLSGKVTA
jgi:predicted nucleotidyltransferase